MNLQQTDHYSFIMPTAGDVRIGISLSGGGARGAAHIGVLQALSEEGLRPSVVAGTSAGAIIGGLYAAGLQPQQMLDFIQESKMIKLLSFKPLTGVLGELTYLKQRLAEVIPHDRFEALQMPLHVAISNLNTGRLEIRSSGELFSVIAASSSIPLVFSPVKIGRYQYVDGGLLCNLPAKPLVNICDFILGVNVMPAVEVEGRSIQHVFSIATRCFDLSIQANTLPELPYCNMLLEPERVSKYHIFQFSSYREIYEIGYEEAKSNMPAIKEWVALKERILPLKPPPLEA